MRFLYNFRQNLLRPFVEIKITLAHSVCSVQLEFFCPKFHAINEIFGHKLCADSCIFWSFVNGI